MASSVVVYDGRLLDLEVARMSILCVMVDLVLGWGLLLASHVLASRTAGSGEAEHAVLPLSVVDNSAFSPNCLTISLNPAYDTL